MSITVGLTGGENLVALIAYACLRLHKLAFYPRCIDIIVLTAANNTFLILIYIYIYIYTHIYIYIYIYIRFSTGKKVILNNIHPHG